jgi:chromosome partitioning protein
MWKPDKSILIINGKGGCGKTTLTTNLAAYYAAKGHVTTMMDYDPQGSSAMWHRARSPNYPGIHFISAVEKFSTATKTWRMRIPFDTERLIIDVPGGIDGYQLQDMVKRVDTILIPVSPSPIDIHATSHFIKDLFLIGKARSYSIRIGVIANRVKKDLPIYVPLQRFLNRLDIPFITTLWDSQNYVNAAEQGLGIHELEGNSEEKAKDIAQWIPLIQWIENENMVAKKQNVHYINQYNAR